MNAFAGELGISSCDHHVRPYHIASGLEISRTKDLFDHIQPQDPWKLLKPDFDPTYHLNHTLTKYGHIAQDGIKY